MPTGPRNMMRENEDLLRLCQNIHTAKLVGSDAVKPGKLKYWRRILEVALKEWDPEPATEYAACVRALIVATLKELDERVRVDTQST